MASTEATAPPAATVKPKPAPKIAGLGVPRRALVVMAVVAFLGLTYARSITVYLDQQQEIAETKARIEAQQAEVARLEDEMARWSDPNYVKTQARERLGWVMPGETGYRVIAADGSLVGGTTGTIEGEVNTDQGLWYERLASSLKAADLPVVIPGEDGHPAPPEEVNIDTTEHE